MGTHNRGRPIRCANRRTLDLVAPFPTAPGEIRMAWAAASSAAAAVSTLTPGTNKSINVRFRKPLQGVSPPASDAPAAVFEPPIPTFDRPGGVSFGSSGAVCAAPAVAKPRDRAPGGKLTLRVAPWHRG